MITFRVFFITTILLSFLLPLSAISNELDKIKLSSTEKKWLVNNPVVTFSGDPNWLPFEAFDKNGRYIGMVADHLAILEEISGLKFTINVSTTWTESTLKAKQGLIDVLSETDDSQLASHLNFTQPYFSNPIVIALPDNSPYVDSILAIHDKKIGLIESYGYASKIREKYSSVNFYTVDNIHHGLISVSTGQIDGLICTLALCSYTLSDLGMHNVKISGETEFNTELALGVQKNRPELLSILNKAIAKVTPEQKQIIKNRWIKEISVKKVDYQLAIYIAIASFLVTIIFIYWIYLLFQEIKQRKKTEAQLKNTQNNLKMSNQRFLLHRKTMPLGLIEWDNSFKVVDWNPSAEAIFGYSKKEALGKHAKELIIPKDIWPHLDQFWHNLTHSNNGKNNINANNGQRNIHDNITKDGQDIICEWYNSPLIDHNNNTIGVSSLIDDITERVKTDEMIWHQANFDALTDLPNRNLFYDRFKQELVKALRYDDMIALLMLDLDHFKKVNDTLGHEMGDLLLKEAALRLTSTIRESDTVARLGGDEFIIILAKYKTKDNIEPVAKKIIKCLEQPYTLGNDVVHISGSIGITLCPNDAKDIKTLVNNADHAMYNAKKNGRGCFSYFNAEDDKENNSRRIMPN